MAKITYEDKVGITPKTVHINQVWDDDMNEIKAVVNANDDRLTALENGDITPTIAYANWTGTGLVFDVVASSFPVQKTYYSAPNTQVTLSASDATLFRYDLIVAKKPTAPATQGTIQVIEGTLASETLVIPPDYDPSEYYLIKTVLIKPAATEPSDPNTGNTFVSELVYANGTGEPNEWTFSSNSATIVNSGGLINATNPLSTSTSTLTNDVDITNLDSSKNFSLEFDITLKASIENSYIVIKLFDVNGYQMTNSLLLNNGDLGFSASSLSTQKLVVDGSMFSFIRLGSIRRVQIYINRSFAGYTLDNIKFTLNGSVSDSGNNAYTVPNLQEVTDKGNATTNEILIKNRNGLTVDDNGGIVSFIDSTGVSVNENSAKSESFIFPSVIQTSYTSVLYPRSIRMHNNEVLGDTDASPKLDFLRNGHNLYLEANTLTEQRTQVLQDKSGTIALLSDIVGGADSDTIDFWGVIRYNPTTFIWELYEDALHLSKNIVSVTSTSTTNGFKVNINNPNVSIWGIGECSVTQDETLTKLGVYSGASFSQTQLVCPVVHLPGYTFKMNGITLLTGVNKLQPVPTLNWDATNNFLSITTTTVGTVNGDGAGSCEYNVNVIPSTNANFNYAKMDINYSHNRAKVQLKFYDASNSLVQPTGQWYFNRVMQWTPLNNELGSLFSNANFWVRGKLVKLT